MTGKIVHNRIINLLERGLDASAFRHGILAGNVSNVETPGYRRFDMDFTGYLEAGIQKQTAKLPLVFTHENHFREGPYRIKGLEKEMEEFAVRQDASGVDIEKEMTLVLQNALYHQILSRIISDRLSGLRNVIREVR
ncbi:MAG TPA: flagellar basal body rod protein FlgB [Atribacteraceae bacterium]|nr:flagellar basal body rod protein FlgB [Atribacteraceae bacterium]